MHKYFSYIIILSVIFFTGCSPATSSINTETNNEQRSGFTTINGTVRAKSSANANIETTSGLISVETLSVDFLQFDGQVVTATGKYSGDTLFISEVVISQ